MESRVRFTGGACSHAPLPKLGVIAITWTNACQVKATLQIKKRIDCRGDRICVVVVEPSGAEFVLRSGHFMENECETDSDQDIEIKQLGSSYSVDIPDGEVSIAIDGRPVTEPMPFSISEIFQIELAKLPGNEFRIDVSGELVAFLETVDFELDSIVPVKADGKLKLFEIAAQRIMEIARIQARPAKRGELIAGVCRRILALGAIIVNVPPDDFARGLLFAAPIATLAR